MGLKTKNLQGNKFTRFDEIYPLFSVENIPDYSFTRSSFLSNLISFKAYQLFNIRHGFCCLLSL